MERVIQEGGGFKRTQFKLARLEDRQTGTDRRRARPAAAVVADKTGGKYSAIAVTSSTKPERQPNTGRNGDRFPGGTLCKRTGNSTGATTGHDADTERRWDSLNLNFGLHTGTEYAGMILYFGPSCCDRDHIFSGFCKFFRFLPWSLES